MRKTKTDFTKEKVFEIAKKYNLEWENCAAEGDYFWYRFFLPTGYVDDIDEDGERDDLFSFDEKDNIKKGNDIHIYDSYTVKSRPNEFKVEYDEWAAVDTNEELERVIAHMVRCGAKWKKARREFEEEQKLMEAQKDFT